MTNKETLSMFISERAHTPNEWRVFAMSHPFLRVKEVGSNGDVLINLEKGDSWIRPIDWNLNYVNQCKERLVHELRRMQHIVPQDELVVLLKQHGVNTIDEEKLRIRIANDVLGWLRDNDYRHINTTTYEIGRKIYDSDQFGVLFQRAYKDHQSRDVLREQRNKS